MMDKINVVYWSQSGNTQAMAEAVGRGIEAAGKSAEVIDVSSASLDALKAAKVFGRWTVDVRLGRPHECCRRKCFKW